MSDTWVDAMIILKTQNVLVKICFAPVATAFVEILG